MTKNKYKASEKIKYVEKYLDGLGSAEGIARELGIYPSVFNQWVRDYRRKHGLPSYKEEKGFVQPIE